MSEYNADLLDGTYDGPRRLIRSGRNRLLDAVTRYPALLRTASFLARRFMPVLRLGKTIIVYREDDVRDVLARNLQFEIAPLRAGKLPAMPTLLAIDDGPVYRALHSAFSECFGHFLRSGGTAVIWEGWFEQAVRDAVPKGGKLDVVRHVGRPVIGRMLTEMFGLNIDIRDEPAFQRIKQVAVGIVSVDDPADEKLRALTEEARGFLLAEIRASFEEKYARVQQAKGPVGEDLMSSIAYWRWVNYGSSKWTFLNDEALLACVSGLVAAAAMSNLKALSNATEELLRRRDIRERFLARAKEIEKSDEPDEEKFASLANFGFEALRFAPTFPIVIRYAPAATVIAPGTERETPVPAGSSVIAVLTSAAFDEERVRLPLCFIEDRSPAIMLHFGDGQHACLGARLASDMMGAWMRVLGRFEKISGPPSRGRVPHDGPIPDSLVLKVAPAAEATL